MVGRARGFLPYVGMVTILMNEYPKVKVCTYYLFYFNYLKTFHLISIYSQYTYGVNNYVFMISL